MVYHENDDDPSSYHYKSPHRNSAGQHRVGPVTGGGDVYMPPVDTPDASVLEIVGVYVNTATVGAEDFVLEPILYKADQYLQSKGYDDLQKAVLVLSLVTALDDGNPKKLKEKADDLVTVFHFTNKKGYKSITSGKDITIKATKPPANNPVGAYFSKEGPTQLKNQAAAKLRISTKKTEYVIEAQIPKNILKEKGRKHHRIVYTPNNVTVPQGYWKGYKNPYFKK